MRRLILLLSSLIAVTTLALACGDDEQRFDGDIGDVLAALDVLRDANIHHMNMTLAKEDAQIVVENAQREIRTIREKAEASLKRESAEMAITLASKIIGENLDDERNRNLTDKLISEL